MNAWLMSVDVQTMKEHRAWRAMPRVLLTSGFDAAGNRDSLAATLYNGTSGTADFVNHYSYDELSRLIDIIQQGQTGGNAVATKQVYYTLNGIGDVTEMDRSSDDTIGPDRSGPAYTTLGYNPQGLLTSIEHLHQSTALESMIWSYDNLDRVASFQSNDGGAAYGYDRLNEVTSASYTTAGGGHQPLNETYGFDSNGNQSAFGHAAGGDNLLSADGTFDYGYDAEGNRVTRERRVLSPPQRDDLVSYTWDSRNRLTGVEDFSWNAASSVWVETEAVTYTYDVFDHLIQRVDEVLGGSTTTTQYVWDGDRIVLSFDNGVLAARYLNGPNTSAYDQYFSTLAEEDVGTGATTWDLLDDQGTLRDVIDGGGNVVDHLNYGSFGQLAYESAPTVAHLDGYAGGLYDPSTQLVYFIHRWYDPAATVWISADPLGFAAGDANLDRYSHNSPTLYEDPSGLANTTVRTAEKHIRIFMEWFPNLGTAEIKILRKTKELAILKYVVNPKTGEGVCHVVSRHSGKTLPGIAISRLNRIMPDIVGAIDRVVTRTGGRWAASNLATKAGGRVGLGTFLGAALAAAIDNLLDPNTCDAAEIPRPILIELTLDDIGVSEEYLLGDGDGGKESSGAEKGDANAPMGAGSPSGAAAPLGDGDAEEDAADGVSADDADDSSPAASGGKSGGGGATGSW